MAGKGKTHVRRVLGVTGTVAIVVSVAACAQQGGGSDESSFVLYAADPVVDQVVEAFNEDHPDIDVEVVNGTSGEMLARAQAEVGRAQGDVLWIGGYFADDTGELFAQYDSDVLDELYPEFRDAAAPGVPVNTSFTDYIYNVDVMPEDEMPTMWADLADPKWKGKIQLANPATSGAAFRMLVNWVEVGGWDLVEQILPNLVVAESSLDPMKAVAQGEAAIGLNTEQGVFEFLEGPNLRSGQVEDGVVEGFNSIYLLQKDAVSPAAVEFIDWMLSVDGQQWMTDNVAGFRPVNQGVTELPDGMRALDEVHRIPFPEEAVTDKESYLDTWRDLVTSL